MYTLPIDELEYRYDTNNKFIDPDGMKAEGANSHWDEFGHGYHGADGIGLEYGGNYITHVLDGESVRNGSAGNIDERMAQVDAAEAAKKQNDDFWAGVLDAYNSSGSVSVEAGPIEGGENISYEQQGRKITKNSAGIKKEILQKV